MHAWKCSAGGVQMAEHAASKHQHHHAASMQRGRAGWSVHTRTCRLSGSRQPSGMVPVNELLYKYSNCGWHGAFCSGECRHAHRPVHHGQRQDEWHGLHRAGPHWCYRIVQGSNCFSTPPAARLAWSSQATLECCPQVPGNSNICVGATRAEV